MRVVLDTNVLVSALLFPYGALAWGRQAWQASQFVPLISEITISELERVLRYSKFNLTRDRQTALLYLYVPWCETVVVSEAVNVPECRDPSDIPFLELALFANADALVTGDSDLLALDATFPVPIITPSELQYRLSVNA